MSDNQPEAKKRNILWRAAALPFAPIAIAGRSFKQTARSLTSLVSKTKQKTVQQTTDKEEQRRLFLSSLGGDGEEYLSLNDVPDREWERIGRLRKRMMKAGYVFLAFGAAFLGYGFYSLFQGMWMPFVTSVLFAFINGISSNKNFFRAWQIKERRLGTMREFWDSEKEAQE